jgi:sporulation protein YlmC with PRC-barrel domain
VEIEYGAEVIDRNGKVLGSVDYIVRDTYTGEIRKFKVSTEIFDIPLLFSPEDVLESTASQIKLKTVFRSSEMS